MRSLSEYINEGLISAFKAQWQTTKVQGELIDLAEKMIEENPDKYRRGADVLKDLEGDAKKLYAQYVTVDDALDFNQWWKEFFKSASNMLDRMMK